MQIMQSLYLDIGSMLRSYLKISCWFCYQSNFNLVEKILQAEKWIEWFRVQLYIISKYYLFLMIKFSICVLIWYIPDFPHYKTNISLPLLRIQMLIKDWIAFECFKDINYIAMLTKCILGIIFASSWRSKETIIILHNTNEKK